MTTDPAIHHPQRQRPSRAAANTMAGFVVGLLVAVIAIPDHEDTKPQGVEALAGGVESAGSESGDVIDPIGADGTPGVGGERTSSGGRSGSATSGPARSTSSTGKGGGGQGAGGQTQAAADNASLPNGGATARGVTADEITIGLAAVDPSVLAPICPACDPGPAKEGVAGPALVAAWQRDGKLPVNGRTIKVIPRSVGLTADEQRSACAYFAHEVEVFAVLAGAGTGGMGVCLANEFGIPVLDSYGGYRDTTLEQNYPLIHTIAPSGSRILKNLVHWADENGFLKGRRLGMFSSNGVSTGAATGAAFGVEGNTDQDSLNRYFRSVLKEKGYKLTVDYVGGEGSHQAAALEMKTNNVDVAFLFFETADFQQTAEDQGYHPDYPVADLAYSFGEAQASSTYNPDAMDGQIGMAVRDWPVKWVQRKPAVHPEPSAPYCIDAYTAHTRRTLDSFDNSSEISLTTDHCTGMEVFYEAAKAAGGNLTVERWIAGLQTIRNLKTPEYVSVTFEPGSYTGSNFVSTYQYAKNRWQPSNELMQRMTDWRPMWVK